MKLTVLMVLLLAATSPAGAWQLEAQRTKLIVDTTFYVDPAGDDAANDCLTTTTACKTIQSAIDLIYRNYDHGGIRLVVKLKAGTDAAPQHYAGFNVSGGLVGHYNPDNSPVYPHSMEVEGDIDHPNRVVIDSTVSMLVGKSLHMIGMTFTSTAGSCLSVGLPGSEFVLHRVDFGPCAEARIFVTDLANVRLQGNETWYGNAQFGIYANNLALLNADVATTITHSGSVTYGEFVVGSGRNSVIDMNAITFASSSQVTGIKCKTKAGGRIETYGQVANNIFPGTVNCINLSGGTAE